MVPSRSSSLDFSSLRRVFVPRGSCRRDRKGEHRSPLRMRLYPMLSLPGPSFQRKDVAMEPIISDLLTRFENGTLTRRELVSGLAMVAASATGATAQQDIDFKSADIDHISIQVADLQRSTEFYQKMFGFTVVSEDKPLGIVRLGNNRSLVY